MRRLLFLLAATSLTVRCATIAHGPMQRVPVVSDAPGQPIRTTNCGLFATKNATTPAVVWVSRRSTECAIDVGGERIELERRVSPVVLRYAGTARAMCGDDLHHCNSIDDLFAMGVVGAFVFLPSIGVDAATGALFEQAPHEVVSHR